MNRWMYVWLAAVTLVIVVLGAYFFSVRPSNVVERAVAELGETQTARFNAVIGLENNAATEQLLGEQGSVEIALDGAFDRRRANRDALATDVKLTTKTASVSVQVEGEVRFIDDKVYLYIKQSPRLFPVLVQLKGVWLELARGGAVKLPPATAREPLFVSAKRSGVETIDGTRTIKYDARASSEGIVRMMDALADVLGTQLTTAQIDSIRESATQVGEVPVELWVQRWTRNLKQLQTTLTVPGGNTVRFTLTIKDRNAVVDISAPAGAVSLTEAIQGKQP